MEERGARSRHACVTYQIPYHTCMCAIDCAHINRWHIFFLLLLLWILSETLSLSLSLSLLLIILFLPSSPLSTKEANTCNILFRNDKIPRLNITPKSLAWDNQHKCIYAQEPISLNKFIRNFLSFTSWHPHHIKCTLEIGHWRASSTAKNNSWELLQQHQANKNTTW